MPTLNTDYMLNSLVPLFNRAVIVTIQLTLYGVLLSLIIGIIGNIIYYYKVPVLRQLTTAYTELSRNTPVLAQLFFLFFGLPALGIMLSGFTSGVIALSFLGGSYMIEALRSGIEAVSHSQKETAVSLGLTKNQILRHILIPQAVRTAFPSLSANVIFLLRESSLVGVIAVPELMNVANRQIGMFFRTNEVLLMVTIYYLLLIAPLSVIFKAVERRIRVGRI